MIHHGILLATWIGEQPGSSNYVHKTLGLLTDLPHMTVELFYSAVENSVWFVVAAVWANRRIKREHLRLDAEHGHQHQDVLDCQ